MNSKKLKAWLCALGLVTASKAAAQGSFCSMALGNYRYDRLLILDASLRPFVNRNEILQTILDEVRAQEGFSGERAGGSTFKVALALLSQGQALLTISYGFAETPYDQSTPQFEWLVSMDEERIGHLQILSR